MSRRLRVLFAVLLFAMFVLFVSARGIANFYTDFLWFDSLGYDSVWRGVLLAQVLLAIVFIVVMFALLWLSLFIVDRFAPPFRPSGPEEEFVRRYHETVGERAGVVRIIVALLFAILWGATAGGQWQEWILFRNRVEFGIDDPQFNTDLGFYIFSLPFIQFLLSWFFTAFVITLIITAAFAYLNGGIRINAPTERVTPQVKAHLSVLLGVLAIIKAIDYWYQRYSLTISNRGVVDGASYADVNAQLPAIQLLILISICAAALLILNIFRRGWILPVVAVGLWAFVAVVVGSIFPAFYQRVFVEPSESTKEEQLIERNIAATRAAFGLDEVETVEVTLALDTDNLDRDLFLDNTSIIENVRLMDPSIVSSTFERLEAEREIYRFGDRLDVDRYEIDGVVRPVVLAGRELNLAGVRSGWENQHVGNTHGFGVAVALANSARSDGRPNFLIEGVGEPANVADEFRDQLPEAAEDYQQRLYIGEDLEGYAIVGTDRNEVDYPLQGVSGQENAETRYSGADGVEVGGFVRQVAFGIRFGDWDPIFSGLINSNSKIIYNRDVEQRVKELAPFLAFDCDPYPVLLDGDVKWVIDGFTTSDRYPYSQFRDFGAVGSGCDLRQGYNYIRNSVKAVVDAYDGDVTFYITDENDPIIAAYDKAFPELFQPESTMPDGLQEHLRYPADLFNVQTNMWGRYHLTNPSDFFDPAAEWAVARDPGSVLDPTSTSRIPPYYVQMNLPDATSEQQEFLLMRPFVPRSVSDDRPELSAVMFARNDAGVDENGDPIRGQLKVYVPSSKFDGPLIANETMLNDRVVAPLTTLLGDQGSSVRLGNMLLVPLDETNWLWVRPLYVESGNNLPELAQVIVSYGREVRMCPTLQGALSAFFVERDDFAPEDNPEQCRDTLFGIATPDVETPTDEPDPVDPNDEPTTPPVTGPALPGDVAALIEQANEKFLAAEAALGDGDLGLYQELIQEAAELIAEANASLLPEDEPA